MSSAASCAKGLSRCYFVHSSQSSYTDRQVAIPTYTWWGCTAYSASPGSRHQPWLNRHAERPDVICVYTHCRSATTPDETHITRSSSVPFTAEMTTHLLSCAPALFRSQRFDYPSPPVLFPLTWLLPAISTS